MSDTAYASAADTDLLAYLTDDAGGSPLDAPAEEAFREATPTDAQSGQPTGTTERVAPDEASPKPDESQAEGGDPTQPEAPSPAPVSPQWDSDDNPYRKDAVEGQRLKEELRALVEEQRTQQLVQGWQEQLEGIVDADEDAVPTIVNKVIEEVAKTATEPLIQARDALNQQLETSYHGMSALALATQKVAGEQWKEVTELAAELRKFDTPEEMETFLAKGRVESPDLTDIKSQLAASQAEVERLKALSSGAYRQGGTTGETVTDDTLSWDSLLQGL